MAVGENEDGRERKRRTGEPGVICTGVGMRSEYFTRKIQLRLERFSGHVEPDRHGGAFRSISDLVRTFAFLFNV